MAIRRATMVLPLKTFIDASSSLCVWSDSDIPLRMSNSDGLKVVKAEDGTIMLSSRPYNACLR